MPAMKCPTCSEPTKIYDSRLKGNRTWRRHRCPNKHKFTTWEVLESEIGAPAWMAENELNQRVCNAVAKLLPAFVEEIVTAINRVDTDTVKRGDDE